jgi:hypothetical protein
VRRTSNESPFPLPTACLQFFDAIFRGEREEVELVTTPLYPGRTGLLVP